MAKLRGPEINAALVHPEYPTGKPMAKASGCLVRHHDQLYLLTNWHVVTSTEWRSATERAAGIEAKDLGGNGFLPERLRVSVRLGSRLALLRVLLIQEHPGHSTSPFGRALAWEPSSYLFPGVNMDQDADLVCLHVASDLAAQEARLRVDGVDVRFGYELSEIGLGHGISITDRVFVVGYPLSIGNRDTDPPVWTGGTIATSPDADWDGPRFLIDSRTRDGQSGSAVIAYAPPGHGLPARQQLLGIYSGRIDEKADIGSVWRTDDVVRMIRGGDIHERLVDNQPQPVDALLR